MRSKSQNVTSVAITVTGLLRTFERTRASILESMVLPIRGDADVFVMVDTQRQTSREQLEEWSRPLAPLELATHTSAGQNDGLHRCMALVLQHEGARRRPYSWLLRLRPDVAYTETRLPPRRDWPSFPTGARVLYTRRVIDIQHLLPAGATALPPCVDDQWALMTRSAGLAYYAPSWPSTSVIASRAMWRFPTAGGAAALQGRRCKGTHAGLHMAREEPSDSTATGLRRCLSGLSEATSGPRSKPINRAPLPAWRGPAWRGQTAALFARCFRILVCTSGTQHECNLGFGLAQHRVTVLTTHVALSIVRQGADTTLAEQPAGESRAWSRGGAATIALPVMSNESDRRSPRAEHMSC